MTALVLAGIALTVTAAAYLLMVKYVNGFIAGAIWQWRELKKVPQDVELIVMRLANMDRVHPDQIVSRCSVCGEIVGVYPSGQRVMARYPNVKLFCQICRNPGKTAMLAPGAELESTQSRKRDA